MAEIQVTAEHEHLSDYGEIVTWMVNPTCGPSQIFGDCHAVSIGIFVFRWEDCTPVYRLHPFLALQPVTLAERVRRGRLTR